MNRILCLIKAIIRCLTPNEKIEYYKHQKTLVDVDEELVPLTKIDKDEKIVPTKQAKELAKQLDKIVFSDDLEKYRQVNGSLNREGQRIFSSRINAYLNNKKRGEENAKN